MMAGLINQARGRLHRAGDSDRDPADLSGGRSVDTSADANADAVDIGTAGVAAGGPADGSSGAIASDKDREKDSDVADLSDVHLASNSAGEKVGDNVGIIDSPTAAHSADTPASTSGSASASGRGGKKGSTKASTRDRKSARKLASSSAGRSAGSSASRKPRRVGRPQGPTRVALTVRVLPEIDEALTEAVDDTGMSPQYIADAAFRQWLAANGYLRSAKKGSRAS